MFGSRPVEKRGLGFACLPCSFPHAIHPLHGVGQVLLFGSRAGEMPKPDRGTTSCRTLQSTWEAKHSASVLSSAEGLARNQGKSSRFGRVDAITMHWNRRTSVSTTAETGSQMRSKNGSNLGYGSMAASLICVVLRPFGDTPTSARGCQQTTVAPATKAHGRYRALVSFYVSSHKFRPKRDGDYLGRPMASSISLWMWRQSRSRLTVRAWMRNPSSLMSTLSGSRTSG